RSVVPPKSEPGTETVTGSWLEVSRLDGSGRAVLTRRPAPADRRFDGDAAWSPDGSRAVFVRETLLGPTGDFRPQALYVVNRDGSGLRKLVEGGAVGGGIEHPFWSPDGKTIVFQRNILQCWVTVEAPS